MPNIDTLSIQFNANGTDKAVRNIKAMSEAVRSLADSLRVLDTGKITDLSNAMSSIKSSTPTKAQANRMTGFAEAISKMSTAARTSYSLNNFAENISGLGTAIQGFKKSSLTKAQIERLVNLSEAMGKLGNANLGTFTQELAGLGVTMTAFKKSLPTNAQIDRINTFASAVTNLSNAIGAADIGTFSKDMATLGEAVQAFKKSTVSSITNAAQAMTNFKSETEKTVEAVNNATTKNPSKAGMGNNQGALQNFDDMVKSLDKVASRTDALKSKFKGLLVPTKSFKTLEEQAEKVAKKYDELREKMQRGLSSGEIDAGSESYKRMEAQLDGLRNKYDELILKQKELALAGDGIQINPNVINTVNAFKSGFTKVTDIVKNGVAAAFRSANTHIKAFAGHLKNAARAAKETVTGGNKAKDMAKKFASELMRVSKMLKLMITRKALRAVIAEVGNGFQSLAIHSDEFNNSMSSLINGSKKLGYSFATMVSPLINALAPAIVYVINLLTKLLNVFNQVMSALTGATSWNKAKDFTDSWRDSIEGAGSAAKKTAKELKKTVLGFDELNQLQDNKDSSSGSGNSIADMFETMEIDPKWKNFADWLKKMWDLGDFTELGAKLGKQLRDLLESIPWEKIRKTANKLGGALATLINGFVEVERLGYDIGNTLAQSVNTVFEFLNGFVHKLHWDSIGKFIADTFNGFFENIDWVLIKDTVVTGMAGIAEAIQNFIDNFHWDNISNFIINAVDTIVSGVKAFIEGIDWLDLGKKIGEQIRKTVEGIDFYDIGEAIGEIIQAAVDWVSGMLETLPSVETLIEKASDLIEGLFDTVDSEQIGKNLAAILNNVYDFLVGFWKENGDEIKAEVKKFFKGLWDEIDKEDLKKVLGGILLAATIGGIASALGEFTKTYLTAKITAMVTKSVGAAGVKEAATAAGTSIGTWLLAGVSAIFTAAAIAQTIYYAVEDVKSYKSALGVDSMWEAIFSSSDDIKAAKREYAAAKTSNPYLNGTVSAGVQDVANAWTTMQEKNKLARTQDGENVAKWADETARKFREWQEENKKKLEENKKSVGDWAEETARKFKEWQENNDLKRQADRESTYKWAEDTSKKISDWVEGFKTKLTEFKGHLEIKIGEVRTVILKKIAEIKEDIQGVIKEVKGFFSADNWTFEGVGEGLKKTFKDAKKAIGEVWNDIADGLNGSHEVGGHKFSINLPKIKYATGGFPEDGLFFANHNELVGEFSNGKTAVANNAQIVSGIEKGVYSAVTAAMARGGNEKYIANDIYVDGDLVARTISKAQDNQNRRYSPQMG